MSDQTGPGGRAPSQSLPPPRPPKFRARHRYRPGDFQDGRDYVSWSSAWNGRAKYPSADRSNRLEPWGRDPETNLVIAPHGISPVSGTPRLTPPTVGAMKNQQLQTRQPSDYASTYTSALNKNLTEILERRFDQLGFDPWATLVSIAQNEKAEHRDRIDAIKTMLPFLYARKKHVEVSSKKEIKHTYVISVPAPNAESDVKIIDVGPASDIKIEDKS